MLICHKVVYVYLFKQNLEKALKIYGKSFKNKEGLYIGHLYWIIQRNTGGKNGIKVRCLHAVCMEGARKSVQLHNIGSMCVTALPTQISLVIPQP